MELKLNLFAIVNTLGAVQCLLTALALFSIKTGNREANHFLALFLTALAIFIFDSVLYDTGFIIYLPHSYSISDSINFLLGPSFFFYVKSLTMPGFTFNKKNSLHFLPFVLILFLDLPDLLQSGENKIADYVREVNTPGPPIQDYIVLIIIDLSIFAYIIAAFRMLKITTSNYASPRSQDMPVNTKWLRNLIIALLFITILSFIFDVIPMEQENIRITPFLLTIIVYSMGYVGIRQSEIFSLNKRKSQAKKYEKSALNDKMAKRILSRLKQLMEEEKVFTDGTISLPKLARQLNVSTHHLSQVLNERLHQIFFHLVNEYRIKEARKKLLDRKMQNYTMIEIAHRVGFNSLSAFNAAFKKHTGISPSQYKKQTK